MNGQRTDIEGVKFFEEAISQDEASTLLEFIQGIEFRTILMRGMVARRTVACFGFDYVYRSRSVIEVSAIPEVLRAVKSRCAETAGLNDRFDQVIVSRYPPDAGIGWHTDSPVFGDDIMGLSLAAPGKLQLRPRGATTTSLSINLPPRSLYVLNGPARWEWQHRVPAVRAERYSLTFRIVGGVCEMNAHREKA
jgi:alkylated DNA repair dioxygenase AlkB